MSKNPRYPELYRTFSTPLFRFIAKRMGADQKTVEEVFEETIVAAWKGYKSFRHKSSYFTWLCRIALNKIADYYHDQIHEGSRIVVPLIDSITEADPKTLSPEEEVALRELRESVNDCLNLLPPEKRKLLQFRYWYDLSYTEIAKMMGISERAVEGQLYRARHEFAHVWEQNKK